MLFVPEEGTKSMDEVMSATKEAVMKENSSWRKYTSISLDNNNSICYLFFIFVVILRIKQ